MYDTLRVAQLVVLMTNFIFEGAYFFTWLIHKGCAPRQVIFAVSEFVLLYFVLDRLCWLVMILHIRMLKKLKEGNSYIKTRNQIKSYEKFNIFGFLLLFSTYMIFSFYVKMNYYSYHENESHGTVTFIYKIFWVALSLVIIVVTIVLYFFLKKEMRQNLHFYYDKNFKTLTKIALFNVFYLTLFAITKILRKFNYFVSIYDPRDENDKNNPTRWIYSSIIMAFLNFTLYVVVYLNVNVIDFKRYLSDIYFGYSISHHFPGASCVIKRSCIAKKELIETANNQTTSLVQDSMNSKESTYLDTTGSEDLGDSKVRNNHLHNYKQLYLTKNQ